MICHKKSIDIAMDLTRKCTYHHSDVSVVCLQYIGVWTNVRENKQLIAMVELQCGKTNVCRRSLILIIRLRHDVGFRNIHRDVGFP